MEPMTITDQMKTRQLNRNLRQVWVKLNFYFKAENNLRYIEQLNYQACLVNVNVNLAIFFKMHPPQKMLIVAIKLACRNVND